MADFIFNKALMSIKKDTEFNVYGPVSFRKYLNDNDLPKVKTAEKISIDSYEKLDRQLKKNNTMVLRLGRADDNSGTKFALIKVNDLNDYFLKDADIFVKEGQTYLPTKSIRELFAYQVFPFLSETSYVNLGVVSGLFSRALGLDEYNVPLTPATGKSTFTFELYLHSLNKQSVFTHNDGQVEIDGVVVAERKGKQTIFVIEAKSDRAHKSLAKHKLVYPVLALASKVPKDMEIVPVYIKVFKENDGIHYHIVECELPDSRERLVGVDELKVVKSSHFVLPVFDLK